MAIPRLLDALDILQVVRDICFRIAQGSARMSQERRRTKARRTSYLPLLNLGGRWGPPVPCSFDLRANQPHLNRLIDPRELAISAPQIVA